MLSLFSGLKRCAPLLAWRQAVVLPLSFEFIAIMQIMFCKGKGFLFWLQAMVVT